MGVFVGLPVYNEGSNLRKTLLNILGNCDYSLILIDDGSTDEGVSVLREVKNNYLTRVHLTIHEENKGLGKAIDSIIKDFIALAKEKDMLVIMDADGTHKINQIPDMLNELHLGKEVIIASRWTGNYSEKGVPLYRKIGSRSLNVLLGLFTGVPDSTCGYRLFTYKVIKEAEGFYQGKFITEKDFIGTYELLFKIVRIVGKSKIGYIPLNLDYGARESHSKMRISRELKNYGLFIIRNLFGSILRRQQDDLGYSISNSRFDRASSDKNGGN